MYFAMLVTLLIGLSVISLFVWLLLSYCWGSFWRADQRLPTYCKDLLDWPTVAVVIPARNEVATIAEAIHSLVNQDYPGNFLLIVVDDCSDDGTLEVLQSIKPSWVPIEVVECRNLPTGWTGKLWAISQGLIIAEDRMPEAEFFLFTDADIAHAADSLRRLVCKAEADKLALTSLMVKLRVDTRWARLLVPAFVFYFQKLYPFRWVNDIQRPEAAAAGGCMLVRSDVLKKAGGVEQISDKVIDDCALAKLLKGKGSIWLGLADDSYSLRGYKGLSGLWNMVARTAFVQLKNSWLLLSGTVMGMLLLYFIPPFGVVVGIFMHSPELVIVSTVGWWFMAILYGPTLRLYELPFSGGCLLPLAGVIYTAMTVASAWRTLWGRGAQWKGRSYGARSFEAENKSKE